MLNVRIYDRLESMPGTHAALFAASAGSSFFLSLEWFQYLAANILSGSERLQVLAIETKDGLPLLVLPSRCVRGGSAIPLRELSGLVNYYSALYSPLVTAWDENAAAAVKELARFICTGHSGWDALRIQPMAHEGPQFDILVKSLREAGMVVQEYFCFGNWYLPVESRSYEQYFQSLPSVMRNTLSRKGKKLAKSNGARIKIISCSEGLESAIESYESVYAASWKVTEPYPGFVPGLIRMCARQGTLRLGLVYVDDKPAAAQFWIVSNGTASIYKLAYDETFSELSVGSLLTARLMEHVLDQDKVKEVDYLAGDDAYKKQWMSHRRERWGIMAFNPKTVRGCFGIARHVGGHLLKHNYCKLKTRLAFQQQRTSIDLAR